MSTPTLYGIQAAPMALADEKGNAVIVDAIDNHWTERLARSVTIDMGAAAFIALFVLSGAQMKASMIGGTLRLAEAIGDGVLEARRDKGNPITAVLAATGGFRLFEGKIGDVDRRTVSGFATGRVTMDGIGPDHDSTLTIQFQNENLVAIRDGDVLATVPDLITILESDSGEPITTEDLRYGHRAVVVGLPCDERWRTPAGLDLVGPRYFGYDIEYEPVEVLAHRMTR